MSKRSLVWVLIASILALAIGAGGGYWFASQRATSTPVNTPAEPPAKQPLFYRNPMNPEITSPVPAKDEMGMDYITYLPTSLLMPAASWTPSRCPKRP